MADPYDPMQEGSRRQMPIEQRRQLRHESRTNQTWKKFLKRIESAGLPGDQAEKAAVAVLCTLEQRLIGREPEHLEAQLPQKLRELLHRCDLHEKHQAIQKLNREEFLQKVSEHLGASGVSGDPEQATRAVFGAVRDHISEGEVEDVIDQLPRDLAELWEPAPPIH